MANTAKPTETQETGSLQNFQFDDGENWFDIKPEETTPLEGTLKEVKGQVKLSSDEEEGTKVSQKASSLKDAKDGSSKKDKDDDDEEEELTFFEDPKEEEEEKPKNKAKDKKEEKEEKEEESDDEEVEEEKDPKEKDEKEPKEKGKDDDKDDDKFFNTLASELKEKGIFQNIELPKDKVISEEEFFELQEKEIEARVDETFEQFFEELDEDAKAFLKFKKDGGRTEDFLATYSTGLGIEELDENDEGQRTKVLTHYLATVERLDAEEIEDRVKWLKEGGKEKATAVKYFNKIKESEESKREALKVAAEKESIKKAEDAKAFNAELTKVLSETETVKAFPITKTEQKELGTYITKPTVKVGKNKYVPAFNADVAKIFRAATAEDKKKLILIAKLVKTDFDTKGLVTEVKTTVAKKVKSKLQEARSGVKPASSGNYQRKALGDFFDQ